MDWILILALGTFALLALFLVWNKVSVKRNQNTGGKASGVGGPNDPLSGSTKNMRNPDQMRVALDTSTGLDARKERPKQ